MPCGRLDVELKIEMDYLFDCIFEEAKVQKCFEYILFFFVSIVFQSSHTDSLATHLFTFGYYLSRRQKKVFHCIDRQSYQTIENNKITTEKEEQKNTTEKSLRIIEKGSNIRINYYTENQIIYGLFWFFFKFVFLYIFSKFI